MDELTNKINVYIVFEDELNKSRSKTFYDLVYFDNTKNDLHALYLDVIPRVGETIELRSKIGLLCFSIQAVHHCIYPKNDEGQYVKILLRHIAICDAQNQWFY